MAYNYLQAMTEDIINYINWTYFADGMKSLPDEFPDRDSFAEHLDDVLYYDDSVTGNGDRHSYTLTDKTAERLVTENYPLLIEACYDFSCVAILPDMLRKEEYKDLDVIIRLYLLRKAIDKALDELDIDDNYFTKKEA